MIRLAEEKDIPVIAGMVAKLHAAACVVLPLDEPTTKRFLSGLLRTPLGRLWVADDGEGARGFLAASLSTASISMRLVAVEHGWWAEKGGLQLLQTYLAWAEEQGCFAVRMSTPPGGVRAAVILKRNRFELAEQAWVRVL